MIKQVLQRLKGNWWIVILGSILASILATTLTTILFSNVSTNEYVIYLSAIVNDVLVTAITIMFYYRVLFEYKDRQIFKNLRPNFNLLKMIYVLILVNIIAAIPGIALLFFNVPTEEIVAPAFQIALHVYHFLVVTIFLFVPILVYTNKANVFQSFYQSILIVKQNLKKIVEYSIVSIILISIPTLYIQLSNYSDALLELVKITENNATLPDTVWTLLLMGIGISIILFIGTIILTTFSLEIYVENEK